MISDDRNRMNMCSMTTLTPRPMSPKPGVAGSSPAAPAKEAPLVGVLCFLKRQWHGDVVPVSCTGIAPEPTLKPVGLIAKRLTSQVDVPLCCLEVGVPGAGHESRRRRPCRSGVSDPLLSRENLQARVTDYTSGRDAALGLISPLFADLSGLPPLIIQAGTHEVLLDDALRLAQQAATADVEVTLDITPGCPTSSRPITRSSTKRPRRWTEPDSSCRRSSPAQNASPESATQNALCPHNPEVSGSNRR